MNAIQRSIAAGVAFGILAVILSFYIFSPTPISPPASGAGHIHLIVSILFPFSELLYIYGFVIVGLRYKSNSLVWTSWFLILAAAAQIPVLFGILVGPAFGTESLPWFYYACNYWEEIAGAAFGTSLLVSGMRIGKNAILAGAATIILNFCYLITATPPLATELVLLASTGLGVVVLVDATPFWNA